MRDDGPSRPPAEDHPAGSWRTWLRRGRRPGWRRPTCARAMSDAAQAVQRRRSRAEHRASDQPRAGERDASSGTSCAASGCSAGTKAATQEALALTEHALAIDRAGRRRGCGGWRPRQPRQHPQEHGRLPGVACTKSRKRWRCRRWRRIRRSSPMPCTPLPTSIARWGTSTRRWQRLRLADQNSAHLLPVQRSFHLTSIAHIELQNGRDRRRRFATYRQAIELSRRARHAEGLAQALRTLGEVLFELGRHEEALPCLAEAAEFFAQLEDAAAEADDVEPCGGRARTGRRCTPSR